MTRAQNIQRYPYQYAGRALNSRRLNRGQIRNWLGEVQGELDTRQSTGERVISDARYSRGRHPAESVAHYHARIGR